ncbi:MAG: ChbG/HpnK family deacetylase [Verrucomicrobiota bacterium]|nr:ChbG/HpnK family deacetylase [Verrucomicrobiota bacterium]
MIRLITRGDDAASSFSANRAMREACEHGIMKNVGVMAPGIALADAAEVFKGLRGVAFGLHFCLNAEWESPRWHAVLPKNKVPDLYDHEGMLYSSTLAMYERKVPLEQMVNEFIAQLATVRKAGFQLTYVDDHMGVTWLPGLRDAVADIARKEGLIFNPKVDSLPEVDHTGLAPFDHATRLMRSLENAPDGTYLTVGHPTYNDAETAAIVNSGNPPGYHALDRDGQRLMYMRPDVLEFVQKKGIQPIRYDEI